jgi:hypothetical protein
MLLIFLMQLAVAGALHFSALVEVCWHQHRYRFKALQYLQAAKPVCNFAAACFFHFCCCGTSVASDVFYYFWRALSCSSAA